MFDYDNGARFYGDGTTGTLGMRADDGNGGVVEVPLTVNILNDNDDPVFTSATYAGTVNEEQNSGALVTVSPTLAATDADGNTVSYSLIGRRTLGSLCNKSVSRKSLERNIITTSLHSLILCL